MRCAACLLCLATLCARALGDTLDVPSAQYPSIQSAIDDAGPGDDVLVAPGTYTETFDFSGKAVTVHSSGGRDVTTLDGGGSGPVVVINTAEGPSTVLAGFTFVNCSNFTGACVAVGGGTSPRIEDCSFVGNYAYNGCVYCSGSSPTVTGCRFESNTGRTGAGVYAINASPIVEDCEFVGNSVTSSGAGVGFYAGSGGEVSGCLFDDNDATSYAGGLYISGSSPTIGPDNTFTNNTASEGGALRCDAATSTITGNLFQGNTATNSGGAIRLEQTEDAVTGNRIIGNTAQNLDAGGLYCHFHDGEVTGNLFDGNAAAVYGGGLRLQDSGAEVADNVFVNNTAGNRGGGAYLCCGSTGAFTRNVVMHNSTTGTEPPKGVDATTKATEVYVGGGGIALSSYYGPVMNNLICYNYAHNNGGGILSMTTDIAVIKNNTISYNEAGLSGGGIYFNIAPTAFWNNIISHNTGYGAYVADASEPPHSHNALWANTPADYYGIGPGTGDVTADPLFADPGAEDFHLAPTSPCIDAGTDADGTSHDFDNQARPADGDYDGSPAYDIGADEWLAGWLAARWNMLSIPVPPDDPGVEAVFDKAVLAGNLMVNNLYAYSPSGGYSAYPQDFTQMDMGAGYWLLLYAGACEDVDGTPNTAEQRVPLEQFWNLVGYPFDTPQAWAGCSVSDGIDELSIDDAGTAGWIQTAIFAYEGVYIEVPGDDEWLRPWQAYWLLAYQGGLQLVIPAP